MYKGLKGLLAKGKKSSDEYLVDYENQSSLPSDSVNFSQNEMKRDSQLLDKMLGKMGDSSKLKEQDKLKLYNTLKKIQPRPNADIPICDRRTKRFTPKLETSNTSTSRFHSLATDATNLNSSSVKSLFEQQSTPSFSDNQFKILNELHPDLGNSTINGSATFFSEPITTIPDLSHPDPSDFQFSRFNNSTHNLSSDNFPSSLGMDVPIQAPLSFDSRRGLALNGGLASTSNRNSYINNFDSVRSFDFNNDAASEIFSTGSLGSINWLNSQYSPALSEVSNSGLSAFELLGLDDSPSAHGSPSGNGLNSVYQDLPNQSFNVYDSFKPVNNLIPSISSNSISTSNFNDNNPDGISEVEYKMQLDQLKSDGIKLELSGIPSENAKSRVETQIKITLKLVNKNGVPIRRWTHLMLPEILVSRDRFRHRLNKSFAQDSTYPLSEKSTLFLDAKVVCSSSVSREVNVCINCIRREFKRSLRKKDIRNIQQNNQNSLSSFPVSEEPKVEYSRGGGTEKRLTGVMEKDWDEDRLSLESKRIVIFNCYDLADFSSGEIVLPTRITCYCRHHDEKVGFCLVFTLRDYKDEVISQVTSPPVMITDDHKSAKFKSDRKAFSNSEYRRSVHDHKSTPGSLPRGGEKRLVDLMGISPSLMAIGNGISLGNNFNQGLPLTENAISAFNTPNASPSFNSDPLVENLQKRSLGNSSGNLSNQSSTKPFGHSHAGSNSSANFFYNSDLVGNGLNSGNLSARSSKMISFQSTEEQNSMDNDNLKSTTFISPDSGPIAGGLSAKISGEGFKPGDLVFFNEHQALNVFVWSSVFIECIVPPAVKHGPVKVVVISHTIPSSNKGELSDMNTENKSFCTFNYVENTDTQFMELVMHIISLRGRIMDRQGSNVDVGLFLNQSKFSTNIGDSSFWDSIGIQNSEFSGLLETNTTYSNDQIFSSLISGLRVSSSLRDLSEMENQVDLRQTPPESQKPLTFLFAYGDAKIGAILVGADYRIKTSSGRGCVYLASRNGHSELAHILSNYIKKDYESSQHIQERNLPQFLPINDLEDYSSNSGQYSPVIFNNSNENGNLFDPAEVLKLSDPDLFNQIFSKSSGLGDESLHSLNVVPDGFDTNVPINYLNPNNGNFVLSPSSNFSNPSSVNEISSNFNTDGSFNPASVNSSNIGDFEMLYKLLNADSENPR
ncbi:Protein MGA2 [Smittium mucronatum]|uniref:Protein MGA2 n=1 Tax=Smittium mucronatum TaxID=133383 RepID=A0A1R0GMD1_9FUNG|nr:Protein MGA2 [Smittium mucronatum]